MIAMTLEQWMKFVRSRPDDQGLVGERAALAEIDRLRAQVERTTWRLIATAPKDGTTILCTAWEPGFATPLPMVSAYWSQLQEGWWAFLLGKLIKPTHWQPQPEPPTVTSDDSHD